MVIRFYPFLFLLCLINSGSVSAQDDYKRTGIASYYHDKFEGRKTSNGEKFRQKKLTCAHRTLPFGTLLKVTNLANDKSVVVRVNDRGPFVKGRIIDLSKTAAKELDFIKDGCATVRIEMINEADTLPDNLLTTDSIEPKDYVLLEKMYPASGKFSVQVGFYAIESNMEAAAAKLKADLKREILVLPSNSEEKKGYHVMVGIFEDRGKAFGFLHKIIDRYPGAFIVTLE